MKSRIHYRFAIAVITAGLLAACSAASPDDDKKAKLEKLKTEQANLAKEIQKLEAEIAKENPEASGARAKEVGVEDLKLQKFNHYIQTQGKIESENDILVSAKSPGVVTQVFVHEGDQVTKGQVLAQVDNSIILRSIESAKTQLELATSVYERQKNLWDQKIGTEVQYLQTKTAKENLEKQIASLQEQNDMTRIKAPISGIVDNVRAKVGENIAPGMPAAHIVNNSDLKLTANVSEAFVTSLKKGNRAVIKISDIGKEIQATVTFVGRSIDQLSRTFPIEVKLPTDNDLRPNMTATVKVIFKTEPSAIVIPVNVVQDINNEKVVYIVEAKGNQTVARRKVVTVEGVYGSEAEVKGLQAGDKLITVGFQGLNDGDRVKI